MKTMKITKFFYLTPEIQVLGFSAEGILCQSSGSDFAGAGNLDDNPWGGLTFGETND